MIALHHRTYGKPDAPPVVLLHGLFGSSANWGSVARWLADEHYVIAPDLRNHGQSPHDSEHSYTAMAADVRGLLDALGCASVTLIGHSMGGKVAMQLALSDPSRIARLAVVDIAPVHYDHHFDDVFATLRGVDLAALQSRADADAQMAGSTVSDGVRAFLLQNLVRDAAGWSWRLNIDALEQCQRAITGFPAQADGARYNGPSHFIHGALSDYVQPTQRDVIQRWFPHATFCRIDNAGHWVYADQPHAFAACVDAFLATEPLG